MLESNSETKKREKPQNVKVSRHEIARGRKRRCATKLLVLGFSLLFTALIIVIGGIIRAKYIRIHKYILINLNNCNSLKGFYTTIIEKIKSFVSIQINQNYQRKLHFCMPREIFLL